MPPDPDDPRETTATDAAAINAGNESDSDYTKTLDANKINALNDEVLRSEAVVEQPYELVRAPENERDPQEDVERFSDKFLFSAYTESRDPDSGETLPGNSPIYIWNLEENTYRAYVIGDLVGDTWEIKRAGSSRIIVQNRITGVEEVVDRRDYDSRGIAAEWDEGIDRDLDAETYDQNISRCGFPKGYLVNEIYTEDRYIKLYKDPAQDTMVIETKFDDGKAGTPANTTTFCKASGRETFYTDSAFRLYDTVDEIPPYEIHTLEQIEMLLGTTLEF